MKVTASNKKATTLHKKIAPKGDRLNWTPLKSVKSAQLEKNLAKGKQVSLKDLQKSVPSIATRKALIP